MVQEKDAAKKRRDALSEFLRKRKEQYDKSVIKKVWAVYETTPAYNTGGYYDQDVPEENVRVSPYFDTRKEALEWMDKHEADKGKYLRIGRTDLREVTHRTCSGPFLERKSNG